MNSMVGSIEEGVGLAISPSISRSSAASGLSAQSRKTLAASLGSVDVCHHPLRRLSVVWGSNVSRAFFSDLTKLVMSRPPDRESKNASYASRQCSTPRLRGGEAVLSVPVTSPYRER